MMRNEEWQKQARCTQLTPSEADMMFFPGSGGKPSKAKTFCGSCPVQGICLSNAIVNKLEGFFSGTTDDERRTMKGLYADAVVMLSMPSEPKPDTKRKIYLALYTKEATDHHKWMDEVSPPDEAILMIDTLVG